MQDSPPKVAIAGASGFVGRALCARLAGRFPTIGLSRRRRSPDPGGPDVWAECDLFSVTALQRGLQGASVAVYLVHSMMPSTRLTQGSFEDIDFMLADNFGRAAAAAGVRRIVYLGGLLPDGAELSAHLRSRAEVETALGAHGVPVTTLRAGLVVGPGGSSFQMLVRLVDRLPVMVCPKWMRTKSQPIALDDVVSLLEYCIAHGDTRGQTYDVGSPDVVSYAQMVRDVAQLRGRLRPMVSVPLFSPGLSRLWVSLVTGAPRELVAPLIQSLRHPMITADRRLQERAGISGTRWRDALAAALAEPTTPVVASRRRPPDSVRSVQRLPRPRGLDAEAIAAAYLRWLPRFAWPFLVVDRGNDGVHIRLRGIRPPLLRLVPEPDRSVSDRSIWTIASGVLVRASTPPGRLEFRLTPDGTSVVVAVHDYRPRLPWWIYVATQAIAHLVVMWSFGRYLARRSRRSGTSIARPVGS